MLFWWVRYSQKILWKFEYGICRAYIKLNRHTMLLQSRTAHRGSTFGRLLLQRFRAGLLLSTHLVSSQWWLLISMFAVLIHWWVEVLHVDRTISMCIWTSAEHRVWLLQRKTGSSPCCNLLHTVTRRWFSYGLFQLSVFVRFLFLFGLLFNLFRTALRPSIVLFLVLVPS